MEPWKGIPWGAEPRAEQGCWVTGKGQEVRQRRKVERRMPHQVRVPFVDSSGIFKS